LRNIHPGEVLEKVFLEPLGLSAYRLAKDISVPATRIAEILNFKRSVTADIALRLSRYFGTSAKFWLGLQQDFDLEELQKKNRRALSGIQAFSSGSKTSRTSMAAKGL
jgi:antitoxin HigA-1